jgi:pantoate--beta-alanine ligase
MRVFQHQRPLGEYLEALRRQGKTVGFVPTMGALHAGHVSLITLSKKRCDVTVCSVFVNPTQFNDPKDLEKYPRTEKADTEMLEKAGCDVLYLPDVKDVYPDGVNALVDYDLSPLDSILEGASRPGHFKGVANVVKRLLDAVQPEVLFLGQKDFQQVAIVKRLTALVCMNVQVVTGDILREANGLAMSSRNERLNEAHRAEAGKIHEALQHIESSFKKIPWQQAQSEAVNLITSIPTARLDYLKLCDVNTLEELTDWNVVGKAVALVAVYVDGIRLIDNVVLR